MLKEKLECEICKEIAKGKVYFQEARFNNILRKLAISNIAYETDDLKFTDNVDINYKFAFQMNKLELDDFNKPIRLDIIPEIGSRICNRVGIVVTDQEIHDTFVEWIIVQNGRYRYLTGVSLESVFVRIVINELLYIEAIWQDAHIE